MTTHTDHGPMRTLASSLLVLAGLLASHPALAQSDQGPAPDANVQTPETSGSQAPATTPSIQSSLGTFGDPGSIRATLDKKGIDYSFTYIADLLGNTSGGVKQGATYEGRLDMNLDVDLEKLVGFKNGAIHVEAFEINGRGLTGNNTMDLFTTSGIEAYPSAKLYEAWYEHKLDDGKLFVRIGQLAADTEFFISQTATLFVNSSYGFPAILANDLPSGGPAYPLATPGARVKYAPNDNWTFLAAIFNGDPAGPFVPGQNAFLPQVRDGSGTLFRLQDAPLIFTEAQYAYNQGKDAKGLPGTIKVGYVHHFGDFQDQTVPSSIYRVQRGDDFAYGIIDQTIYRKPGTDDQGASVFVRVSGSPNDVNLIDFYADAGVSYKGLIPGRPDDTAGISGAYAHISNDVSTQDILAGNAPLIRDYSGLIEATYQYVVAPGFSLQPDFQYLFHPGAHGVAIPNLAYNVPIHDAAVFGLRATIHY
ncbi:MAG: carbohydrate porin [Beijerinckiaceae bacterium]|nr:carbohydrate porin [Beijerinckiaceae bacterium]